MYHECDLKFCSSEKYVTVFLVIRLYSFIGYHILDEPYTSRERKVLHKIFGAVCEEGEWRIRTNDEVYKLYGELELIVEVKKRRLQYLCHVVRMEEDRFPKKILDQHPGGRRKPGRTRKRWLDDVTKDLEVFGI
jgi:hypothetical protein